MQLVMLFAQVEEQHKRKTLRNSRSQMLSKIVLLFFFLNIVKKTPALDSSFNKSAGLKVCIFIKKETPTPNSKF